MKNKIPVKWLLYILVTFINPFMSYSQSASGDFVEIFDGKTLNGWDGDPRYWRVENGAMVGEVTPETILKRNSFIIKKDLITRNFELKVDYRVSASGNSGINYRSSLIDSLPYSMMGYQADIDGRNRWSGQNYEERGRTFLALRGQTVTLNPGYKSLSYDSIASIMKNNPKSDSLQQFIKREDWNEYRLVVNGNRMQHFINGVLMSDVTDNDAAHATLSGKLGVQVHVGPPMKIEYKNFRYKDLSLTPAKGKQKK
jgi:hypothetical protein